MGGHGKALLGKGNAQERATWPGFSRASAARSRSKGGGPPPPRRKMRRSLRGVREEAKKGSKKERKKVDQGFKERGDYGKERRGGIPVHLVQMRAEKGGCAYCLKKKENKIPRPRQESSKGGGGKEKKTNSRGGGKKEIVTPFTLIERGTLRGYAKKGQ